MSTLPARSMRRRHATNAHIRRRRANLDKLDGLLNGERRRLLAFLRAEWLTESAQLNRIPVSFRSDARGDLHIYEHGPVLALSTYPECPARFILSQLKGIGAPIERVSAASKKRGERNTAEMEQRLRREQNSEIRGLIRKHEKTKAGMAEKDEQDERARLAKRLKAWLGQVLHIHLTGRQFEYVLDHARELYGQFQIRAGCIGPNGHRIPEISTFEIMGMNDGFSIEYGSGTSYQQFRRGGNDD